MQTTADHPGEPLRYLKVRIPVRQHIEPHTLSLLTDRSLSDIVDEALTLYVQKLPAEGRLT